MGKKQIADAFGLWMVEQGYMDSDGVLTIELRIARALWLQHDIQARKVDIESNFIQIAKNLWEVYRDQLWEPLDFNNFQEYLSSPEIDMSKSVGYGLQQLGLYLEEGLISEEWAMKVGTSKVRTLLPKLKEGVDVEEWMAKAEILTNLDLQDEVAGKEIIRYSGTGPLMSLIEELHERPAFWKGEVHLRVKTI